MKIYKYKVFVALGLVLASMTGCAGALPSPSAGLVETRPIPQTHKGVSEQQLVETPEILQTCAAMPSGELQENRGCYASYFFGMDVGVNVTGNSTPGISVRFNAMVPDGSSAPQWQAPQAIRCPSIMARWPSAPESATPRWGTVPFRWSRWPGITTWSLPI